MDVASNFSDSNVHQTTTIIDDDNEEISSENEKPFSFANYDVLIELCRNNIKYFEQDHTTMAGKQFSDAFHNIVKQLTIIREFVTEFNGFSHEYDFDEMTPANGYRSIVKAAHGLINYTTKLVKCITPNRGTLLFRKMEYVKRIETCSQALSSMCSVFEQANIVRGKCDRGSLFPASEKSAAIDLFNISQSIDQTPFYSRVAAFQYCRSMQVVMKLLEVVIVWYSELYYNKHANSVAKVTSLVYNCNKSHRRPNYRAKRYLDVMMYSGIDFATAFLQITEMNVVHVPFNMFSAKIKVNRVLTIPPEPLEIDNVHESDKMVNIPVPSSHLGVQPIRARLLSNVHRQGMQLKCNKRRVHPMSNSLIFHCHGGGFVAHTSKSHEIYLREWAAQLQVPILSIDYSLSPHAPYPRALEEVFYAYCWAIKNAQLLGTTAERIVVVGDSAGAALNMALTLKCIQQSVRLPDGGLFIYCPMNLTFAPTPSRLLTAMDTLISFGFLLKCLKAYVHPGTDQFSNRTKGNKKYTFSTERNPSDDYCFDVPRDPFISPLFADDEMLKRLPPIKFLVINQIADLDPFIDDSVTMAKRLRALGKDVGLDVLPGLPHGFLNLVNLSKDAHEGSRRCISRLTELLNITLDSKE